VKRPIAYVAGETPQGRVVFEQGHVGNGESIAKKSANSGMTNSPSESSAPPSVTMRLDLRRAVASPSVRRLARQLNINLAGIEKGSGPGGRIISTDLERIVAEKEAMKTSCLTPICVAPIAVDRRPLSKMRRTIAARLLQSKQLIPHFYVKATIRVDRLWSLQSQMKERGCSFNDLIVLACGRVLGEFPSFRCQLAGNEIITYDRCNVGIAVSVEDGLLVPVVKDVDRLTLLDLTIETKRVIAAARTGVVANSGQGCITISNLGMYGVDEFTAIINPPEPAILAVGAVREQVIVEDGYMRPGRTMSLTLSADHRLIDGVDAAKFLARLRSMLEFPSDGCWQ
jgi:pyruvate dehydrogenase E2 component (dihydrolipoamide acetyltransferase)